MNKTLFLLLPILFLLSAVHVARADSVTPGETFAVTGSGTQTSGPNCCGTASVDGLFTVGTMIGATSFWTVSAFDVVPSACGASDCSTLVWNFSGLEFDASNDTLSGVASSLFTGNGGDSREMILDFTDGNTSSDALQNNDLTREALGDTSNDKPGTFTYTVAPVPEASSLLLLGTGLFGLIAATTLLRKRLA